MLNLDPPPSHTSPIQSNKNLLFNQMHLKSHGNYLKKYSIYNISQLKEWVVIDREHILWSNLFGKLQNHCAQLEIIKMVMTVISISVLFRLFIYCAHTARVGYKQCLVSTIPIKLLVSKVCANIVFVFVYGKIILNKILPKKKRFIKI